MVSVAKGDYAILSIDGKKKALVKVTDDNESSMKGMVVDETAAKRETRQIFSFDPLDVMANLGPMPKTGSVFGVKIEPLKRFIQHPDWGDIYIFRTLEQIEEKVLLNRMSKVSDRLKKLGIFPYRKETQVHVRPPGGKYAGLYMHNSKAHDVITYKAEMFDHENMDYYLTHEWGHGIWFTMMPPQYRAHWTKFYIKNTQKLMTGSQRLTILMKEYIESGMTVREFGRSLDDTDKLVFKEILGTLHKVHSLDARHLDDLRAESAENITTVWPKTAIELPQHQILVSDYANKNPDEFWCEAFSYWFIGKQIPKDLENAVLKTIAACKHS